MHFRQRSVGGARTAAPVSAVFGDTGVIAWKWSCVLPPVTCSSVMVTSHCWPFLHNYPCRLGGIAGVVRRLQTPEERDGRSPCSPLSSPTCGAFVFWAVDEARPRSLFHFLFLLLYAPVTFSTLMFHVGPHGCDGGRTDARKATSMSECLSGWSVGGGVGWSGGGRLT